MRNLQAERSLRTVSPACNRAGAAEAKILVGKPFHSVCQRSAMVNVRSTLANVSKAGPEPDSLAWRYEVDVALAPSGFLAK